MVGLRKVHTKQDIHQNPYSVVGTRSRSIELPFKTILQQRIRQQSTKDQTIPVPFLPQEQSPVTSSSLGTQLLLFSNRLSVPTSEKTAPSPQLSRHSPRILSSLSPKSPSSSIFSSTSPNRSSASTAFPSLPVISQLSQQSLPSAYAIPKSTSSTISFPSHQPSVTVSSTATKHFSGSTQDPQSQQPLSKPAVAESNPFSPPSQPVTISTSAPQSPLQERLASPLQRTSNSVIHYSSAIESLTHLSLPHSLPIFLELRSSIPTEAVPLFLQATGGHGTTLGTNNNRQTVILSLNSSSSSADNIALFQCLLPLLDHHNATNIELHLFLPANGKSMTVRGASVQEFATNLFTVLQQLPANAPPSVLSPQLSPSRSPVSPLFPWPTLSKSNIRHTRPQYLQGPETNFAHWPFVQDIGIQRKQIGNHLGSPFYPLKFPQANLPFKAAFSVQHPFLPLFFSRPHRIRSSSQFVYPLFIQQRHLVSPKLPHTSPLPGENQQPASTIVNKPLITDNVLSIQRPYTQNNQELPFTLKRQAKSINQQPVALSTVRQTVSLTDRLPPFFTPSPPSVHQRISATRTQLSTRVKRSISTPLSLPIPPYSTIPFAPLARLSTAKNPAVSEGLQPAISVPLWENLSPFAMSRRPSMSQRPSAIPPQPSLPTPTQNNSAPAIGQSVFRYRSHLIHSRSLLQQYRRSPRLFKHPIHYPKSQHFHQTQRSASWHFLSILRRREATIFSRSIPFVAQRSIKQSSKQSAPVSISTNTLSSSQILPTQAQNLRTANHHGQNFNIPQPQSRIPLRFPLFLAQSSTLSEHRLAASTFIPTSSALLLRDQSFKDHSQLTSSKTERNHSFTIKAQGIKKHQPKDNRSIAQTTATASYKNSATHRNHTNPAFPPVILTTSHRPSTTRELRTRYFLSYPFNQTTFLKALRSVLHFQDARRHLPPVQRTIVTTGNRTSRQSNLVTILSFDGHRLSPVETLSSFQLSQFSVVLSSTPPAQSLHHTTRRQPPSNSHRRMHDLQQASSNGPIGSMQSSSTTNQPYSLAMNFRMTQPSSNPPNTLDFLTPSPLSESNTTAVFNIPPMRMRLLPATSGSNKIPRTSPAPIIPRISSLNTVNIFSPKALRKTKPSIPSNSVPSISTIAPSSYQLPTPITEQHSLQKSSLSIHSVATQGRSISTQLFFTSPSGKFHQRYITQQRPLDHLQVHSSQASPGHSAYHNQFSNKIHPTPPFSSQHLSTAQLFYQSIQTHHQSMSSLSTHLAKPQLAVTSNALIIQPQHLPSAEKISSQPHLTITGVNNIHSAFSQPHSDQRTIQDHRFIQAISSHAGRFGKEPAQHKLARPLSSTAIARKTLRFTFEKRISTDVFDSSSPFTIVGRSRTLSSRNSERSQRRLSPMTSNTMKLSDLFSSPFLLSKTNDPIKYHFYLIPSEAPRLIPLKNSTTRFSLLALLEQPQQISSQRTRILLQRQKPIPSISNALLNSPPVSHLSTEHSPRPNQTPSSSRLRTAAMARNFSPHPTNKTTTSPVLPPAVQILSKLYYQFAGTFAQTPSQSSNISSDFFLYHPPLRPSLLTPRPTLQATSRFRPFFFAQSIRALLSKINNSLDSSHSPSVPLTQSSFTPSSLPRGLETTRPLASKPYQAENQNNIRQQLIQQPTTPLLTLAKHYRRTRPKTSSTQNDASSFAQPHFFQPLYREPLSLQLAKPTRQNRQIKPPTGFHSVISTSRTPTSLKSLQHQSTVTEPRASLAQFQSLSTSSNLTAITRMALHYRQHRQKTSFLLSFRAGQLKPPHSFFSLQRTFTNFTSFSRQRQLNRADTLHSTALRTARTTFRNPMIHSPLRRQQALQSLLFSGTKRSDSSPVVFPTSIFRKETTLIKPIQPTFRVSGAETVTQPTTTETNTPSLWILQSSPTITTESPTLHTTRSSPQLQTVSPPTFTLQPPLQTHVMSFINVQSTSNHQPTPNSVETPAIYQSADFTPNDRKRAASRTSHRSNISSNSRSLAFSSFSSRTTTSSTTPLHSQVPISTTSAPPNPPYSSPSEDLRLPDSELRELDIRSHFPGEAWRPSFTKAPRSGQPNSSPSFFLSHLIEYFPSLISSQLALMRQQQLPRSQIRLSLQPPSLGSVNIVLTLQNNKVSLKITLERSQVRDKLEKTLPLLREALQSHRLHLDEVVIQTMAENHPLPSLEQSLQFDFSNNHQRYGAQQEYLTMLSALYELSKQVNQSIENNG